MININIDINIRMNNTKARRKEVDSYVLQVMARVTNLTYSVCNILKRVIQLIFAVLVFKNQVSFSNALGMLLAMLGISLYTFVRSTKGNK